MRDFVTYFITWTTYGTWLPGDARGWRKRNSGEQAPQPRLEQWCRGRMTGNTVVLSVHQRRQVEDVCHRHAEIRGWALHAVNGRSNHVHLVESADKSPNVVRDQFKANATRILRQETTTLANQRVWARGGDCEVIDGEVIDGEDDLEQVVRYVLEAQDRMGRDA